ncbi:MAG: amino acid ABC transporter ATP-binding protein [Acidobacteria bacterium]|nr:amino acid ABC transporter ATP-binding protein [Acidobacteriota bacterium]
MSAPVLSVDSLQLRRGARTVLHDVDLEVGRGERVALMGLSGGGKTTVLRAIVALEAFDGGSIDVDGVALRPGRVPRESELRALRAKVGMVFQMHCLFEHLTALGNVTLAPVHVFGRDRAAAEARAHELLDSLGAGHRHDALPCELSGGEAQRVAIARALAVDPPLLLMDEPTASLDPARRSELAVLLRTLAAQGRTLVVSTHDVDFARDFASRIVVLAKGEIVEQGPPSEILEAPQHPETKRLLRGEQ